MHGAKLIIGAYLFFLFVSFYLYVCFLLCFCGTYGRCLILLLIFYCGLLDILWTIYATYLVFFLNFLLNLILDKFTIGKALNVYYYLSVIITVIARFVCVIYRNRRMNL